MFNFTRCCRLVLFIDSLLILLYPMKQFFTIVAFFSFFLFLHVSGQTPVPNGDFENWINHGSYEDPQYWSTPNSAISLALPFGTQVVTKSTDHESGNYSARMESKQLTV